MWWEQLKKLISECLNVLVSGCNIFSKCTSVLANVSDITATAVSTQAHYVAEVRENYFPLCVSISSVAFCLIDFIFCASWTHTPPLCIRVCTHLGKFICITLSHACAYVPTQKMCVWQMYDITLKHLKSSKNHRLWFKTSCNLVRTTPMHTCI